ncbi:MAG: hypothetical protein OXP71_08330, partial [Candidatus Poribacteria bacterium]|nr:hypothetical protein [Candidatus Poribacteria bacterium]
MLIETEFFSCKLGFLNTTPVGWVERIHPKTVHENQIPRQPNRVQDPMNGAKPNAFKTSPIRIDCESR